MPHMKKGDDTIFVDKEQIAIFEKSGYEITDAPVVPSAINTPYIPDSQVAMISMSKDGQNCVAAIEQRAILESSGWKYEGDLTPPPPSPVPGKVVTFAPPAEISLYKDNNEIKVAESQVEVFIASGWSKTQPSHEAIKNKEKTPNDENGNNTETVPSTPTPEQSKKSKGGRNTFVGTTD